MATPTSSPKPPKQLLSPREIGELYGISPDHLRNVSTTELPRYRLGHRTLRYKIDDLERYLARRKIN